MFAEELHYKVFIISMLYPRVLQSDTCIEFWIKLSKVTCAATRAVSGCYYRYPSCTLAMTLVETSMNLQVAQVQGLLTWLQDMELYSTKIVVLYCKLQQELFKVGRRA